jgi:predicted Zn-dependent protease
VAGKSEQFKSERFKSECLRTWARALALSASLAFVLAACSSQLADNRQAAPAVAEKPAEMSAATQREHARILAAYGGAYEQPKLEALLARTVDRLVAASERPDFKYKVTILNSQAINAFALSNGQLYVTRGLIALANDTSELASVLSHEMAHVIARHASFREDQARQAIIFSRVATDLLGDPQMGALALARSKIALASFSRAQEFEADGIGVGISARAGYDPYGAQRFLTSMGLNADLKAHSTGAGASTDQRPPDFFSSHPSTPERIKNARANARQYVGPGTGKRDKNEYLTLIDNLIYGDDPSDGFVRGRRFLHPKLGFTFTAPEGFVLDNTAQAVFGVKDGGTQALRLDVVHAPNTQALADYLDSGWIENIDRSSISESTVNGLPAATATARNNDWTFRLYVVRFENDVYRFIFASKNVSEATERAFRDSIGTFRPITPSEAASAKPHRIKVVKVAAGATVETLARRMAIADRAVERFRALNGLGVGDKLKQGELVKIVVD